MSLHITSRETIFALATPPGRAALAVIRISGPEATAALSALTARPPPPPRQATLARLYIPPPLPGCGLPLDKALVLLFPAPRSYTGEDVAELHVHGGRAVVQGVLAALAGLEYLRPAEPGEFTRRAFENDRMDLTEAEGIADLIDAETTAQRTQALRQMDGALTRLYEDWRERLLRQLAHIEASIDFPDEDLPTEIASATRHTLEAIAGEIGLHLNDKRRGLRMRDGLSVVIIGPPNAGKSSLLNALAQREAAIVSPRSGTTRDIIEAHLDLSGYPVILADTAGLRSTVDELEGEGVRRAIELARHADYKIAVFDGAVWPSVDPSTLSLLDDNALAIVNKRDIHGQALLAIPGTTRVAFGVSVLTGAGLPEFIAELSTAIATRLESGVRPPPTRLRHSFALETCRDSLLRALSAPLSELYAEDARLAIRALGQITGRVEVSELLDVIFRDFCIGK